MGLWPGLAQCDHQLTEIVIAINSASHREHSTGNVVKEVNNKIKINKDLLCSQRCRHRNGKQGKVSMYTKSWRGSQRKTGNRLPREPISTSLQAKASTNAPRCAHKMFGEVQSARKTGRNLEVQKQRKQSTTHSTCIQWPLSHRYMNGLCILTKATVHDM